jgi:cell division protein ZapA
MSQSVVSIRLNGHPYQIGCGAGEEEHVAKLGEEVEAVMQSLIASVGQIGEARLLAMVALILADRAVAPSAGKPNTDAELTTPDTSSGAAADNDAAAELLEDAAVRIAALASKLASGTTSP